MQAFSWMLIHSLWQGLLLAIVAAVWMQLSKRGVARVRYAVVLALLGLFIIACGCTFIHELSGAAHAIVPLAETIGHNASGWVYLSSVQGWVVVSVDFISAHAFWLVLIWAVFFVWRSVKMVQGVRYLQRTKYRYTQIAIDWQERFTVLCGQLHIKGRIRLLESAWVKVPMVIGHLKPVVLMPVGLLAGLPVEQVEAVLLHELAHIRRCDYLVNLLQVVSETVFFFNPGFLWVSALLRDEREHCCDDVALEQTGNKRGFIEALIRFKEHAMSGPGAAVAFPGKKNQLLHRVSRIIDNKNQSLAAGEKMFCVAGVLLLSFALLVAAIAQLRSVESEVLSRRGVVSDDVNSVAMQPELMSVVSDDNTTLFTKEEKRGFVATKQPVGNVVVTGPVATRSGATVVEAVVLSVVREKLEYKRAAIKEEVLCQQELRKLDQTQAGKDRQQVMLNAVQAERNRLLAEMDKVQAERDRVQAAKDRQQAARDCEQAKLDRLQAEKDRIQADKDRAQADRDRVQADRDRANAEKDRLQAMKDREITSHL
ncbi:regulatory sensor-transducer, BlaR1/MecR1 family [Filimonas lacunae]|nr:regulatory sensor-transducer, BlaR1/MecR1 family [Filimonas lacunae]